MANILDTLGLTTNGQLPTVQVNVTVDNQSIWKMAGAIVAALVVASLLHIILTKNSK